MSKKVERGKKKRLVVAGSREVVEAAIDAAKTPQIQTWESAADKSDVLPWGRRKRKECQVDDYETVS